VGADPIGIAPGEGSLWVVNAEIDAAQGTVTRIDPATGEVLTTVDVGVVPLQVAVGEGGVWVSNSDDDTVSRIDPSSDEVVAEIDVLAEATVADHGLINPNQVMAFEDRSLWLPILDDGVVLRVAPPATTVE